MAETTEKKLILRVRHMYKTFPISKSIFGKKEVSVKAVTDVSFDLYENETLGLVGETGCGKSTTGRCILRLVEPDIPENGMLEYNGYEINELNPYRMREMRKDMQMIFQDPYTSLNPRITIGKIVEEPLRIYKMCDSDEEYKAKALEMLKKVGIREDQYNRYPSEFSGGQRQRIGLARALILNPGLLICDEPVSALDVSTQSQVLNLMRELKKTMNLTCIFISHNMSVVRYVSDRIGVMYLGHIVEEAPSDELFANPIHPYTQALLSAVPEADPSAKRERIVLHGELPSPINPPSGCVFHNRCPYATEICNTDIPERREVGAGHYCCCHHFDKSTEKE